MIQARFRNRSVGGKNVSDRHLSTVRSLSEITWLWETSPPEIRLVSNGISASYSLNPYMRRSIKGAINYSPRYENGHHDKAIFDDFLTLEIDEDQIHYSQFSGLVFEQIVSAFAAYRATIVLDINLDINDYEAIVEASQETGKDIDGRDTVYRFNPVNYFDNQLCLRAFQLSAEEVVSRLDGEIERASIYNDGALIIATTDLVDRENLRSVHNHIAGILGVNAL